MLMVFVLLVCLQQMICIPGLFAWKLCIGYFNTGKTIKMSV